ncbi:MAG: NAD(P)H-quinone oxidoreductase subunit I, chloroplastic [Candidatus Methanophagaceae archaeon]|nr:MAG: NAD(P)H-quinone oxidoreductase subunit I, chloroplastic [Methanophagales archaeon]KAF5432224.1 Ferredoxin [Methanophagales archaeon]
MIKIDRFRCAYCGACATVCPTEAISLMGVWIDLKEEECNNCKACVNICPIGALEMIP